MLSRIVGESAARTIFDATQGPANVDGEFLEVLADHVHASRFGDGLPGLAAGQGFVLHDADLPACFPAAPSDDGLLLVRSALDAESRTLSVLWALARHALQSLPHGPVEAWSLTLAIGAPRNVLRDLRARGQLTPDHLAAVTGLPAWAAAWRLRHSATF